MLSDARRLWRRLRRQVSESWRAPPPRSAAHRARDAFLSWARATGRRVRAQRPGIVALGPRSSAHMVQTRPGCSVRITAMGTRHQRVLLFAGAPIARDLDEAAADVEALADRDLGRARSYR